MSILQRFTLLKHLLVLVLLFANAGLLKAENPIKIYPDSASYMKAFIKILNNSNENIVTRIQKLIDLGWVNPQFTTIPNSVFKDAFQQNRNNEKVTAWILFFWSQTNPNLVEGQKLADSAKSLFRKYPDANYTLYQEYLNLSRNIALDYGLILSLGPKIRAEAARLHDTSILVSALTYLGYAAMTQELGSLSYSYYQSQLELVRIKKWKYLEVEVLLRLFDLTDKWRAKNIDPNQYLLQAEKVMESISSPKARFSLRTKILGRRIHQLKSEKKYKDALRVIDQLIETYKSDAILKSYYQSVRAEVLLKLKDYKASLEAAEIGYAIAVKNHLIKERRDNLDALYTASAKLGNFENAFHYLEEFNRYQDSVTYNSAAGELMENELSYTHRKQKQADSLEFARIKRIKDLELAQEKSNVAKQRIMIGSTIVGFFLICLLAFFIFRGKKQSDQLLQNILPAEVAKELKKTGSAEAKNFDSVTVMFTDVKNFTQITEAMSAKELVAEIHTCFKAFDEIIAKYNIEKIKTIGDSYMAASGLPQKSNTHAQDVINAALEMQHFLKLHNMQRKNDGKVLFEMRLGIHTGPVIAGIVGIKKFAYDIWGDTVNTASRMESNGEAGKVNISEATYELVKDKFKCTPRGKIAAKHKGEMEMYFVEGWV